MKDMIYPVLKKRLDDVYSLSPNDLQLPILTRAFKKITAQLKYFPFKIILPLALVITLIGYLFVGYLIVRLASILQFGF